MTASRSAPTASSSSAIATPVRSLPAVQCTSTAADVASVGDQSGELARTPRRRASSIETYERAEAGQLGESLLTAAAAASGSPSGAPACIACCARPVSAPSRRASSTTRMGARRGQPVGRHHAAPSACGSRRSRRCRSRPAARAPSASARSVRRSGRARPMRVAPPLRQRRAAGVAEVERSRRGRMPPPRSRSSYGARRVGPRNR